MKNFKSETHWPMRRKAAETPHGLVALQETNVGKVSEFGIRSMLPEVHGMFRKFSHVPAT